MLFVLKEQLLISLNVNFRKYQQNRFLKSTNLLLILGARVEQGLVTEYQSNKYELAQINHR